ncbi:VirD4-like conjugal transfer protein, CD1115 family [Bacillus safensis]|uniref:VirD4-like conjugal transfer protein, CD1115 family n=1 Tax=Bacillus safensis TaxID=561879 RepID=UPI0012DB4D39|nr:type IV secretory system conjugative DNA transfer family protein [Bacillus safensis]
MKLKKGFYYAIIPIVLLTALGTHIISIFLYVLTHPESIDKMDASMIYNMDIYDFIWNDDNGKQLLILVMILLVILSTYLVRQSIFQKTYKDDSEFGVHGHAKFQNPLELMNGKVLSKKASYSKMPVFGYKKALKMEEGLILGKVGKKVLVLPDKTSIPNRNVFIQGASGAGKGQSWVIPNLINIRNQSIVVIDVKGENWHLTHQLKVDQGYKVGVIDFVDFSKMRFNPLAYVDTDEEAQKFADNTAKNALVGDEKEDYFKERGRVLLRNMVIYVKTNFPKSKANFDNIIYIFDNYIANELVFNEWIEQQNPNNKGVQELKAFFAPLTGKTRSSVTSAFDSLISIYRLEKVREMTKESDFDFSDFVNEKYVLYIKLAVPSNPYQSLTSAFFTQMIDAFFTIARESPISQLPRPINLFLDECANIGKIEAFSNTLSLCRGYLIYIATIVQNPSQMIKLYGKEEFRTIIGNHDTKLVLSVGEPEAAKYFSEYFGDTTVKYDEVTGAGNRAESKAQTVKRALVTPNDLSTLDVNNAYVLFSGYNVAYIEKSWQYEVFGDLITKDREFNYPKFREKIYKDKPLYVEEKTSKKGTSFTSLYEEQYGTAHHEESSMPVDSPTSKKQEEEHIQSKINEFDKENYQVKMECRLAILDNMEDYISKQEMEEKQELLSQLKEKKEAILNGESEAISNLVKLKDRNVKKISNLKVKHIEDNIDAENDENDNLLSEIASEINIHNKMIEILEVEDNVVGSIIEEYQEELNILNKSEKNDTVETDVEDPFKDFFE